MTTTTPTQSAAPAMQGAKPISFAEAILIQADGDLNDAAFRIYIRMRAQQEIDSPKTVTEKLIVRIHGETVSYDWPAGSMMILDSMPDGVRMDATRPDMAPVELTGHHLIVSVEAKGAL